MTFTFEKEIIQQRIVQWYQQQGRKNLPWQHNPSPYRVWLSEVMLQQTQVDTVIPYFHRFINKFPTVIDLASAPLDAVLYLWSGLGYYARARNLHRAAQIIVEQYQGEFPNTLENLQALPGIGRSTAGAILSFAFQQAVAILDGNVKRVFARLHAIKDDLKKTAALKQLWQLVEYYLPSQQAAQYNQALMDLGALICTPRKPECQICPLLNNCIAYKKNLVESIPLAKAKRKLPVYKTHLIIFINDKKQIMLERRPPLGIWGGLWCFPQCDPNEHIEKWCQQQYGFNAIEIQRQQQFQHSFTHFHYLITPICVNVTNSQIMIRDDNKIAWVDLKQPLNKGVAKPVEKILSNLDHGLSCPDH